MSSSATNKEKRLSRRTLFAGGLTSALLAGCANPALLERNIRAVAKPLFDRSGRELTRDQVAQFSAASISLEVGNGLPKLLLLTAVNGPDHVWGVSGQTILQTRGGRLVATGGLQHDLKHSDNISADPAEGALLTSNGATCSRLLDFPDDYGAACQADSKFHVEEPETLTILGARLETIRVSERVHVSSIGWHHTNKFWADTSTGMVWRSRQHAHPDIDALTITTLRPSNV
ncbi:MAG: YjbF family lipoprotein [Alphaproteobacteria bacterium]